MILQIYQWHRWSIVFVVVHLDVGSLCVFSLRAVCGMIYVGSVACRTAFVSAWAVIRRMCRSALVARVGQAAGSVLELLSRQAVQATALDSNSGHTMEV